MTQIQWACWALLLVFTPTHAQERQIFLEGSDQLRYSKQTITVAAGTKVELTLKTVSVLPKSQMAHNWVLLKKDTDVEAFVRESTQHKENDYIAPGMTGQVIAYTKMLGAGESDTITFTVPSESGEYAYVCTFPTHYEGGMDGILLVR